MRISCDAICFRMACAVRIFGRMPFFAVAMALLPFSLFAQEPEAVNDEKCYEINQVTLVAERSLSDMGVSRTRLDTVVLRENISNSLADILSQKTPIFIKSYGRGTVSTASFRGTSPSHTQVLWNGIKINSPMLGMTDFSLIPSYFISDATIYHGSGSASITSGGLGGAIDLVSRPESRKDGLGVEFSQGISSFCTFDDYLDLSYKKGRLVSDTKAYFAYSKNDFKYTNYYKKNPDGTYPVERNKNGNFMDMHLMQQIGYSDKKGNGFSFALWGLFSDRGVPMLNVTYRDEDEVENNQKEYTLRAAAGWKRSIGSLRLSANIGYAGSFTEYSYKGSNGMEMVEMMNSKGLTNSISGNFRMEYFINEKWGIAAKFEAVENIVSSYSKYDGTGYDMDRLDMTMLISMKYRPVERLGIALNVMDEYYGGKFTPVIPSLFADYVLWPEYNLAVKASISKNYRTPSLNDLYFQPGGNPDLKPEDGFSYEVGMEFGRKFEKWSFSGGFTGYDSEINNWIVWLPSFQGYWTPVNVKLVHSYGVEAKAKTDFSIGSFDFRFDAFWAWTRSVNYGDPTSWADESIGKQLVYVPEYSAGITGVVEWRNWIFTYRWNYYSERYTTSSNDIGVLSVLGKYYMSDIFLEKRIPLKKGQLCIKGAVYNLFNEEYVSVLSRPMPRMNFGLFVSYRF